MPTKDLLVPLASVLLGSVMTLAGTYMQAEMTAKKEATAQRQVKLEQLLESVQMMDYCRLEYTRNAEMHPECRKTRPNDKALALSVLYFPELTKSFGILNEAVSRNRESVSRCRSMGSPESDEFRRCVEPFVGDKIVAHAIGDFTAAAFITMQRITSR
ncbi:MAG: hypothetical protein JSR83_07455 [Proteobacteria bacterium]|nr:hypothetical protein [Pseudomonadota bacterium]